MPLKNIEAVLFLTSADLYPTSYFFEDFITPTASESEATCIDVLIKGKAKQYSLIGCKHDARGIIGGMFPPVAESGIHSNDKNRPSSLGHFILARK